MDTGTTKACPFCAETIQAQAILCRFCGRNLAATFVAPATPVVANPKKKDLPTPVVILIVFALVVGFGLANYLIGPKGSGGTAAVPVPALGYGTIVGYDLTTETRHISDITLHNAAADDPCSPCRSVGSAHEGDRVTILERRANGAIKVRTPNGTEGWTDSEFVKAD